MEKKILDSVESTIGSHIKKQRTDATREKERLGRLKYRDARNAHAREKYKEDPEKFKEVTRRYRRDRCDRVVGWETRYRNEHKGQYAAYLKKWNELNRERKNEFYRNYYHTVLKENDFFRLNLCVRTAVWHSLKGRKMSRHWEDLLKFTLEELVEWLERQFTDGMSWNNYGCGPGKWSIDHKIPICYFNFTCPEEEEFKKCWALPNLQPLWSIQNSSKGGKILPEFVEAIN